MNGTLFGAMLASLLLVSQPCLPQPSAPDPADQSPDSKAQETAFWSTVKDSGDPAMLQAYLDRYPSGAFVPLARIMLDKLKKSGRAEPAPTMQREPPATGVRVAPSPEGGAVSLGSLVVSPMSSELRNRYSIDGSVIGPVIAGIAEGSAAQAKGLKVGDTIVEVMGLAIASPNEARDQIEAAKKQDKRSILLTIVRSAPSDRRYVTLPSDDLAGQGHAADATPAGRDHPKLTAPPPASSTQAEVRAERQPIRVTLGRFPSGTIPRGWLGVKIANLPESLTKLLHLEVGYGVLINEVTDKGPGQAAGLRAGDIVISFEGRKLEGSRDLAREVSEKAPNTEVNIEIARVGEGGPDLNRLLHERAESGDANAQTALGLLLKLGVGRAKDQNEAARWFRKAAENGDTIGMLELGVLYRDGDGVAKDSAEAVLWLQKSADAGNARAMLLLGNIYAAGSGVTRDDVAAARWHRRSAEKNDVLGMLTFSIALRSGKGVAKDEIAAGATIKAALRKGDPELVDQLMTNQQELSLDYRKWLQVQLSDLGAYNGPIDGAFGEHMRKALLDAGEKR